MKATNGGSRRANGEGSWSQLPSGKWRLTVVVDGRKVTGPARATKAEALEAAKRQVKSAKSAAAKSPSFTTFAQVWAQRRAPNVSPTTADLDLAHISAVAKTPLGDTPIDSITVATLEDWRDSQTTQPITTKKRLAWIHQVLKAAGIPARCEAPKQDDHHRRPLTPRESARLAAALPAMSEQDRLTVLLCLEMGLRRSEACGLMHEDRDGDGVWIRRTVVVSKDSIQVKHTGKTAKSLSWVPLPPSLEPIIGKGRGFVLGGEEPLNPKTVSDRVRRILREAGVRTAAELMRHDPGMLLKEYARSNEDLKREAVAKAFGNTAQNHRTEAK